MIDYKEFKKEYHLYPYMSFHVWKFKSMKKLYDYCFKYSCFEKFKKLYDFRKKNYQINVDNFNKLQEIMGKKLPINWASQLYSFENISAYGGKNKYVGKSSNAKIVKDMLKSGYFEIQKYDYLTDNLTIKLKKEYLK